MRWTDLYVYCIRIRLVLRFVTNPVVTLTTNQTECDFRMMKMKNIWRLSRVLRWLALFEALFHLQPSSQVYIGLIAYSKTAIAVLEPEESLKHALEHLLWANNV